MKLYITDHADPSVGLFPQTWVIDAPFSKYMLDAEGEEAFRQAMMNIYSDFCDGRIEAYYDDEIESLYHEDA